MDKLTEEQINLLLSPLPDWALKTHPTKSNMTVIHPMAVVDRLNEVFGIGGWNTVSEKLSSEKWKQKTKTGERDVYTCTAKVCFFVPKLDIQLEQFGGSTNDDEGDALKGSATDALTKIASYLGIGATVYKGQGNNSGGISEVTFGKLRKEYKEKGTMTPDMRELWEKCNHEQKKRISDVTKDLRDNNK